jgi:hypothetical protein
VPFRYAAFHGLQEIKHAGIIKRDCADNEVDRLGLKYAESIHSGVRRKEFGHVAKRTREDLPRLGLGSYQDSMLRFQCSLPRRLSSLW